MQRTFILVFGIVAYLVFLPTFLYLIAFVGNLQATALVDTFPPLAWLVPHSVSYGNETGPVALALLVNLGLIALFGLQHSLMARSGFKAWLTRTLPRPAERSVYVLISSLVLILMFWQWRPIPTVAWSLEPGIGQTILWAIFAIGFGMVFVTTFLIDHFDLFGLRQVWANFRGREPKPPKFVTPLFYRVVRHPLYLGFLLAFWATPYMTVGHLVFATGMTAYILIGTSLEERDLLRYLGEGYQRYREHIPKLIPRPGRVYSAGKAADRAYRGE